MGNCVYFDSLIQFTATDTAPVPEAEDKILVWLYSSDAEAPADPASLKSIFGRTTCLVVTAAEIDPVTAEPSIRHFKVANVDVQPDSWHRLTIKAFENALEIDSEIDPIAMPGFRIFIDGKMAADTEEQTLFFPLRRYSNDDFTTITSVSFEGDGKVDQITCTTDDLFPEPGDPEFTLYFSVTDADNALAHSGYTIWSAECVTEVWQKPFDLKTATELTFVLKDGAPQMTPELLFFIPVGYEVVGENGNCSYTWDDYFAGDPIPGLEEEEVFTEDCQVWSYRYDVPENGAELGSFDAGQLIIRKIGSAPVEPTIGFDTSDVEPEVEDKNQAAADAANSETGIKLVGDVAEADVAITDGEGADAGKKVITVGEASVKIPNYYNAEFVAASGEEPAKIVLELNENALAVISEATIAGQHKAAVEMVDGEFKVTLIEGKGALYYNLFSCDTPNGEFTFVDGATVMGADAFQLSAAVDGAPKKFYKVIVTDTPISKGK